MNKLWIKRWSINLICYFMKTWIFIGVVNVNKREPRRFNNDIKVGILYNRILIWTFDANGTIHFLFQSCWVIESCCFPTNYYGLDVIKWCIQSQIHAHINPYDLPLFEIIRSKKGKWYINFLSFRTQSITITICHTWRMECKPNK